MITTKVERVFRIESVICTPYPTRSAFGVAEVRKWMCTVADQPLRTMTPACQRFYQVLFFCVYDSLDLVNISLRTLTTACALDTYAFLAFISASAGGPPRILDYADLEEIPNRFQFVLLLLRAGEEMCSG